MTSSCFKDFELRFYMHMLVPLPAMCPATLSVLITDVCCRVTVLKLPMMKCFQVWDLFMWLVMTKWINLTFPPVMPHNARFEAISAVLLSIQDFRCDTVLLGEFDIVLNRSTIFGVGQFSWAARPWWWKLCDRSNHQPPLNNTASHPSRLESVVHLRRYGSVSAWASLMIEYGDVIMWSRRWWQTCGVSGGKL